MGLKLAIVPADTPAMRNARVDGRLALLVTLVAVTGCQGASSKLVAVPSPAATSSAASAAPSVAARVIAPARVVASGSVASGSVASGSVASGSVAPASVTPAAVLPAPSGSALGVLATLRVQGRGSKTGYSRAQFGPAWADVDHNGCDTRDDILNRDLTDRSWRAGTHDCVVLSGRLNEPYTGRVVIFSKSQATAVQIDHVVALSDAWQKGAAAWPASERLAFANDPLELLAVDGPANEAKGDGDAATWLPPNKAFRCTYVARQVTVKATYRLTITQAEHDAIAQVLAACPAQLVATAGSPAAALAPQPVQVSSAPAAPAVASVPPVAASGGGGVYYANCAAVRAAGKAPLHRGDPGYRSGLDRDDDGIACE